MDRRTLFAMTGATAVAAAMRPAAARAKEALPLDMRGMNGQLHRLPKLDVASNQEFLSEVRTWVQRAPDGLMRVARARAVEVLQQNGVRHVCLLCMNGKSTKCHRKTADG